jgi:hypothetical protein
MYSPSKYMPETYHPKANPKSPSNFNQKKPKYH